MRGLRYDRILAGTALVLVMALPFGAKAQPRPSATVGVSGNTHFPNLFGSQYAAPAPTRAVKSRAVQRRHTAKTGAATARTVPPPEQPPLPAPTASDIETAPPTAERTSTPDVDRGAVNSATVAPAPEIPQAAAAPPADPLALLDPADRPVAEKIRDLLGAKIDKIFVIKKEHASVEAFYQSRNFAPIWLDHGAVTARAQAAIARMKASAADGLDPADYKVADFGATDRGALAEAELKLTAALITFTRHLQAGRFPYVRIGHNIEVPQQPPEVSAVLSKLADAKDIAEALDAFSPPHEAYKKLKTVLADMRERNGAGASQIADGPVLKLAKMPMEDPRVPQLRKRLGLDGDPSDLRYDAKLADAVKKFQKANDLSGTGTLDSRTIKELNGPARDKQIDIVVANMERWRWYPRELGPVHVEVNIPEFQLRVFKDGEVIWKTRIVTGKPSLQTPLLTAEMKYITVNPTWNVPPSIVQNEYLPALQQDPTVLERMGLHVEYNRDGSIHVSQPPGDHNALGRVRFNFPNRFLVYQHDTPDKHLFNEQSRAFSHGCMRVQDPPKYAEVLLGIANPNEGWTAEKIKRMYGSSEQDIHFQNNIPVHLTYQTATVEDGQLVIRKDIYGYDAKMIGAIRSERGMVEMAQERPKDTSSGSGSGGTRRARTPEPQPQRTSSFFEALFGGPADARHVQPPQPGQRRARQ